MAKDSTNSNGSEAPSRPKKSRKTSHRENVSEDGIVIHIDQLVGSDSTKVDFDLTDYTGQDNAQIENPDICIDDGLLEFDSDEVTYSSSRSLIPRPGSEATTFNDRKKLDSSFVNVWQQEDYSEKRIVFPEMDRFEILNAFREIRTQIVQHAQHKNQIVMVVSLQHDMGATFSAVNLAASFAYEGEKTALIVDCDQRQSKLEKLFNQDRNHGFSDYLEDDEMETEDIIYPTGIKRMRYVPMGHRHSQLGEFFTSARTREFFIQLKKRYIDRYIILNAPPLEVSADAAILSELCDQIVVIVPYGEVTNLRLLKALRLLPKPKITGIVINNRNKNYS